MNNNIITKEQETAVKALGFLINKDTGNFSGRVITVNGKINYKQQICIGEAAEKFGNGSVTFTSRLTIEVPGIPYDKIEDFRAYIAKEGLVTGGTGAKIRPVVSCKGTTCRFGLIDTFDVSSDIHERFYNGYSNVKLPHKFKIAVGGCPNNCVKPDLNDVGIIGQKIPNYQLDKCRGCKKCPIETICPVNAAKVVVSKLVIDKSICNNCGLCVGNCTFSSIETSTTGYKIVLGGRWGKNIAIGKPLSTIFRTKDAALDTIEKAILFYNDSGTTGKRFADLIIESGIDQTEKKLLCDDLTSRKNEILA